MLLRFLEEFSVVVSVGAVAHFHEVDFEGAVRGLLQRGGKFGEEKDVRSLSYPGTLRYLRGAEPAWRALAVRMDNARGVVEMDVALLQQ